MPRTLHTPLAGAALFLFVSSLVCFAQTASLVNDINTVPYAPYDSSPSGYTEFNGAVYFSASSSPGEFGLWRTDGSSAGTQLVKSGISCEQFLVSGGTLYFVGDDGTRGDELWKSDGTAAGTVIVKDINPGSANGIRFAPVEFAGALYFGASDGLGNFEVWRSDGTAAGTALLKDIHPTQSSMPFGFTVAGDTLFFAARDESSGVELWKSDGTPQGTTIVKDISPGSASSDPLLMLNAGGVLLFRANDGVNGNELWKSDGTPGGTVMVRDINPGPASSTEDLFESRLFEFDGLAFFAANSGDSIGLWKSDGTFAGTELLQGDLSAAAFQSIESTLYFVTVEQTPLAAAALWKTDGTPAGTQLVAPLDGLTWGGNLVAAGDTLFFTAGETFFDHDLWKSDGTSEGTVPLGKLGAGVQFGLTGIGERAYLSAHTDENGFEPWTSDGTVDGTGLLKDIGIAPGGSIANAIVATYDEISPFATAQGRLFFAATDGVNGVELWKTDGTENGTVMVRDINPSDPLGVHAEEMVNLNGQVLFSADDGENGFELWRSDGTDGGTVIVKDIHPEPGESSYPTDFAVANGTLYFSATDPVNGNELWRSDGTAAGTTIVKDIAPGVSGSFPSQLQASGDTLFFIANDAVNGAALWKSDGTQAGTVMVKDIHPLQSEDFYYELVSSGGLVYFRADTGDGHKLWRSDGTSDGTYAIHDIAAAQNLFVPSLLTDVDGTLFFFDGDELWKSDGTEPGTTLVKDIEIQPIPRTNPAATASLNGLLYFIASGNQPALWRSDGTEAGTTSIKQFDLVPTNRALSSAQIVGQAGGALFLSVSSADGYQLWRSHGTGESTTAVSNVFLAPVGPLAAMGSNVFFAAVTQAEGRELWTTPLLPAISSGGVVDAAGFRPTLAPGSLASLFGTELAGATEAAQTLPLPTTLAGARVQVNGIDAPLLFVSPRQINFQVPFEVAPGAAAVTAILGEQPSPGEPAAVADFAPGLFVNPATGDPIVQRYPDGALITAQNPAKPGDILILYVTGIGGLNDPPATGAPATDAPLSTATVTPTITVGGVEVAVSFAGLAPGFVGLGQINIELPGGLPQGSPLPLIVRFGQNESETLQLPF